MHRQRFIKKAKRTVVDPRREDKNCLKQPSKNYQKQAQKGSPEGPGRVPWGVPGGPWGVAGGSWTTFGAQARFCIDFLSFWVPSWDPKSDPKSIKMRQKICMYIIPLFPSIFLRFRCPFWRVFSFENRWSGVVLAEL